MLAARLFLAIVASLYIILGFWCSLSPATTSSKVGLERVGGGGQSEFLTVYGGLEVGLGLVFLSLAWKDESAVYGLLACLLIHGSLVAFRSIGFFLYDALHGMTLRLAIGEWVIFISSVALWLISRIR